MKCQLCGQEMKIVRKDISSNPSNQKKYNRVVQQCKLDDVWISTEIPVRDSIAKKKHL